MCVCNNILCRMCVRAPASATVHVIEFFSVRTIYLNSQHVLNKQRTRSENNANIFQQIPRCVYHISKSTTEALSRFVDRTHILLLPNGDVSYKVYKQTSLYL